MAMTEADVKEMKSLLAVAKKQPVNFGICLGKTPADTVIVLHRIKEAKALGKVAKEAAGGSKVCFGQAKLDGATLTLDCEDKVPAGLTKATQTLLKGHGIAVGVKIGKGELEGENENTAPEKGSKTGLDGPHPDTGKFEAAAAPVRELFEGSASRLKDGPSIRATLDFALGAAEAGDMGAALKSLDKVKKDLAKSLTEHGTALVEKFVKKLDEVKASIGDSNRATLRKHLDDIVDKLGTVEAQEVEESFDLMHKKLNEMVKEEAAATGATLKSDKEDLALKIKTAETAIAKLVESVTKLEKQVKLTDDAITEVNGKLNGPKRPIKKEADKLAVRLTTLRESLVTQQEALENKRNEIAPLLKPFENNKSEAGKTLGVKIANMQSRMDGLKQSVDALPFKEIHKLLAGTVKEMAEANEWREGKDGQGGELRRNQEGDSHGSARHGAQTGVERQARRSATGGIAPDSTSADDTTDSVRGTGVTTQITKWMRATIEWEMKNGKRKIKSRTPMQKEVVTETARNTGIPVDGATSIFANPVLEKLAVDQAIKKIKDKGWNEIFSNKRNWQPFTEVVVYLGPPTNYGKAYKGWGYSITRKEAATLALSEANRIMDEFEKGQLTEQQMLDQMGVEYLMNGGVVAMVPHVRVVLTRSDGTAAWKSLTHFPDKECTTPHLDIDTRRVRKTGTAEVIAAF